jgi:hypothetical protein
MEETLNKPQLNEQQLEMIRLLKNPLPENYYLKVRHFIVQLIGKQLDDTIENWEKDKNIGEEDYERLSKEHFRISDKKH